MRRKYNLSQAGRETLSSLGKARWAAEGEVEQRDAELTERERLVEETLQVPADERLRNTVRTKVASLPEVTTGSIVRVRGTDYRITEDGRLVWLWFPKGQKAEFEDGQWFRFGGRAYRIHDGELSAVPPSTILTHLLDREG